MSQLVITRTGMDAADLSEITLVKTVDFSEATSVAQALEALGNDQAELLKIINAGLAEKARESAREDGSAWHTYKLDESGEPVIVDGKPVVNGVFEGTLVDTEKLNSILLPMAKLPGMGWPAKGEKGNTAAMKRAAKEKALALVKGNTALMAQLS